MRTFSRSGVARVGGEVSGSGGRLLTRGVNLIGALLSNPSGAIGLGMVGLIVILAIFGHWLEPYNPIAANFGQALRAPSLQHWFGTDEAGRDIFSRVIAGAGISMPAGLAIVGIGVGVGAPLGAIAGYAGGWVDDVIMRVTDIFLAFPALVLAMAVAAALGPSVPNAVLAIGVVWWPWYARLMRAQTLKLRSEGFVEVAILAGSSVKKILGQHVLLNGWRPLVVQMSLDVGYAILTLSGLSFIGLGAQPPTPEWGAMISAGRDFYLTQWWYVTFPGLAIIWTVAGFTLLGDGLQRILTLRSV